MDHFAVLTPHGQLLHSGGYNFQKGFIKDLWNSLWTAGDPSGPLQINCSKTKALVRTQPTILFAGQGTSVGSRISQRRLFRLTLALRISSRLHFMMIRGLLEDQRHAENDN